jgi:hypothetical protein
MSMCQCWKEEWVQDMGPDIRMGSKTDEEREEFLAGLKLGQHLHRPFGRLATRSERRSVQSNIY